MQSKRREKGSKGRTTAQEVFRGYGVERRD
jgi:hypothetical protein